RSSATSTSPVRTPTTAGSRATRLRVRSVSRWRCVTAASKCRVERPVVLSTEGAAIGRPFSFQVTVLDINALKLAAAAFKSALQRQDRQGVVMAARRLVELEAPLGPQWPGLVQEVFRWGELDLALAALNVWHRQGTPANVVN